jgi:carbonic anhydrase/acetyltransferase-like protein (isoleucine patch superfamily)
MRMFKRKFSRLLYRIILRISRIITEWKTRQEILSIKETPNLLIRGHVTFFETPSVTIHPDAKIVIEDGVKLNSSQDRCLLSAHSHVQLFATKPGAVIHIGSQTRIHASCIRAYESVTIGKRCLVASNCQITDASGHALSFPDVERRIDIICNESSPVIIEDDVWLCEGVKVLPGVTIGKGTVVGAGSVVTKSLPAYCLAGGIPARVIKAFR